MEQKQYILLLTSIECLAKSGENSRDDVYLKVYVDGGHVGTYYQGSPLKMDTTDYDDVKRYLDIEVRVTARSTVTVELHEADSGFNGGDDYLGCITITRDDPIEGNKTAVQTTGEAKARYKISWRVLSKPIQTLRIHGIRCDQSSAGCEPAAVDAIINAAAGAAEAASYVFGKVKTPRAQAISAAFDAAGMVIECVGLYAVWALNAMEGDDDIYLQHIQRENPDGDQGAFCPPVASGQRVVKMNDGDEISFHERYGQYFRFPLDRGAVTIQIMDNDNSSGDDCLGSLTIGEAEYNRLLSEGAQVSVCSEYLTGRGQGAIYYLCYSVALEDWANPESAPDYPADPDTWTAWSALGDSETITAEPALITWEGGGIDCFARGPSGQVLVRSMSAAGQWGGWADIGGGIKGRPGVAWYNRRIDLVVCGTADTLWHRVRASGGSWGEWQELGGSTISSAPALARRGEGTLHCVVRGPSGQLMHRVFDGTSWSAYADLGGGIIGAPSVACWGPRRVDVVAQGTNGTVWHRGWEEGSGWTAWVGLGGDAIHSSPTLISRGEGMLDCFGRASDGKVLRRTFANNAWSDWTVLGCDGAIKGAPGCVHTGNGRIDVVGRGMDDKLWQTTKR